MKVQLISGNPESGRTKKQFKKGGKTRENMIIQRSVLCPYHGEGVRLAAAQPSSPQIGANYQRPVTRR